mmetsp:Transcript_37694/g.83951  ORF Transcript_37694/g.83951 Transcript_37694/m.83951 type:complete len:406 (+) Transcript_37694:2201-3418(+)
MLVVVLGRGLPGSSSRVATVGTKRITRLLFFSTTTSVKTAYTMTTLGCDKLLVTASSHAIRMARRPSVCCRITLTATTRPFHMATYTEPNAPWPALAMTSISSEPYKDSGMLEADARWCCVMAVWYTRTRAAVDAESVRATVYLIGLWSVPPSVSSPVMPLPGPATPEPYKLASGPVVAALSSVRTVHTFMTCCHRGGVSSAIMLMLLGPTLTGLMGLSRKCCSCWAMQCNSGGTVSLAACASRAGFSRVLDSQIMAPRCLPLQRIGAAITHVGFTMHAWSRKMSFHGSPYFLSAAITSATNSSFEPSARQRRVNVLTRDIWVAIKLSSINCFTETVETRPFGTSAPPRLDSGREPRPVRRPPEVIASSNPMLSMARGGAVERDSTRALGLPSHSRIILASVSSG